MLNLFFYFNHHRFASIHSSLWIFLSLNVKKRLQSDMKAGHNLIEQFNFMELFYYSISGVRFYFYSPNASAEVEIVMYKKSLLRIF